MPKVILIVDKGDKVSDLADAVQYLNARHVTIDRQTQIDNDLLPAGSLVAPFKGSTEETINFLSERARACAGSLANTHFSIQTTVTLEN